MPHKYLLKKHRLLLPVILFLLLGFAFYFSCKNRDIPEISLDNAPGTSPGQMAQSSPRQAPDLPKPRIPPLKSDGFSNEELAEIRQDGYLSYYYRRKYSPEEISLVWHAVNTLFKNYPVGDKQLAMRSILGYHWLVYRTTPNHYMANNVAVTRKYEHLMDRFAKLHEIPPEMLKGIITWENSGGVGKVSWAACAGVGQLSDGAVHTAHEFYAPYAYKMATLAKTYRDHAKQFGFPLLEASAIRHQMEADTWDIAKKHKKLAKAHGVADERLVPECNIEDAAIYLKLLFNNYSRRTDLAISAYHNGGLNNNDIIRDYLNRSAGTSFGENVAQRDLITAIAKEDLRFIDLWKDRRSRDMLNGLRTVYGHWTTPDNRHLSLGDESDIYLWKVAAAYGSLHASDELLSKLMTKYSAEWDVAECQGMRTYSSQEQIRRDIRSGWLVSLPRVFKDAGIAGYEGAGPDYYKNRAALNYYTLPETAGLLVDISQEYRKRTKNPYVRIPLRAALDSRMLEIYAPGKIPDRFKTHLMGASIDIDLANAPHGGILKQIINELYLHDKIFWVRNNGANRITVNPRYGKQFLAVYQDYMKHPNPVPVYKPKPKPQQKQNPKDHKPVKQNTN